MLVTESVADQGSYKTPCLQAPILDAWAAAGGVVDLTFGFVRADEVVQVATYSDLREICVRGDLLGGAVSAGVLLKVGSDVVEGLTLDAFLEFGGPAFGARAIRANHLIDVGLCEFETTFDDLSAQVFRISGHSGNAAGN
mgnify:CR=1 FL=1